MLPLQEWMRPANEWIREVEERGVCSTVTIPLVEWLEGRSVEPVQSDAEQSSKQSSPVPEPTCSGVRGAMVECMAKVQIVDC